MWVRSNIFKSGFVMSLNFVRMLLPSQPGNRRRVPFSRRKALERLREEAACISPIEWLGGRFPPVCITTSKRDFLYEANLNFETRLEEHGVPVDSLVYQWSNPNTEHTWQQDYRFEESQEVYRRLHAFVRQVAGRTTNI